MTSEQKLELIVTKSAYYKEQKKLLAFKLEEMNRLLAVDLKKLPQRNGYFDVTTVRRRSLFFHDWVTQEQWDAYVAECNKEFLELDSKVRKKKQDLIKIIES